MIHVKKLRKTKAAGSVVHTKDIKAMNRWPQEDDTKKYEFPAIEFLYEESIR